MVNLDDINGVIASSAILLTRIKFSLLSLSSFEIFIKIKFDCCCVSHLLKNIQVSLYAVQGSYYEHHRWNKKMENCNLASLAECAHYHSDLYHGTI